MCEFDKKICLSLKKKKKFQFDEKICVSLASFCFSLRKRFVWVWRKDLCKFAKKICVSLIKRFVCERERHSRSLWSPGAGGQYKNRLHFKIHLQRYFYPNIPQRGQFIFNTKYNVCFPIFLNLATIRHHHSHHYNCHHHSHRHHCHLHGPHQDLAGTHLTQHRNDRVAVFFRVVYLHNLLSKYKTVELGNQLTWPSIVCCVFQSCIFTQIII